MIIPSGILSTTQTSLISQRLWWENLADFDATFSYNQGKCEWTDLCPTNTPSSTPSVSFVPTTFCDNGDRVGTFRELKEQIDEATDPDPANRAKIEICSDKPIVFDSIVDISDKYFDIVCHKSDDCVLDLDGYSFVTPYPGFIPGKEFYAGFEGVIIENGSTVSYSLNGCFAVSPLQINVRALTFSSLHSNHSRIRTGQGQG